MVFFMNLCLFIFNNESNSYRLDNIGVKMKYFKLKIVKNFYIFIVNMWILKMYCYVINIFFRIKKKCLIIKFFNEFLKILVMFNNILYGYICDKI